MTAEVLVVRPDIQLRRHAAIVALGGKEAWRILSSPAILLLVGYLVLTAGFDTLTPGDGSGGIRQRAALAEMMATFCIFLLGPITFVATHLAATSAHRSGSDRLLVAAPVDQRRRDLGLCLGVLAGPAAIALALALASAWLAGGGALAPGIDWTWTVGPWSWTDVLQVPAIVLGAGVLGVVVGRWVWFPGSLLLGFVALILGTGWLVTAGGATAVRPWLAPYVVIDWWDDDAWTVGGSQLWHLAYLLALSGLGVCAVALRQPERRARWLAAGAVAVAAVAATGLLQLPS